MTSKKILLTKKGLKDLKKEYEELVKVARSTAVKRVSKAKELGDLSENSEYSSAKEELSFIDGRIVELEEILRQAKTVSISKKRHNTINLGCKVTLKLNDKREVFNIVGEWEADPAKKKISHNSPLGKALLGKKKGERIEVEAPAGRIIYEILDVH